MASIQNKLLTALIFLVAEANLADPAQPRKESLENANASTANLLNTSDRRSADWPAWRGPFANNHSSNATPLLTWSGEKNIAWKVAVPGKGHASPCVVGDRVYLPSADETARTQFLLCYDREQGTLLWRADLHQRDLPPIHANNSHASATAACDGNAAYVVFAGGGELTASAVDLNGKIVWQQPVGKYQHANGYGASPVLFESFLLIANDNQADPAIVALRRSDGRIVWKTARRKSDNSATPIVGVVAGRPQLLLNGAHSVASYDPLTGGELWSVSHETEVAACTMAFDDERVYASGNVPSKLMLCVRADGSGDVTKSHVLWREPQQTTYVPSPLCAGEHLFIVADNGTAQCRNSETGDVLWRKRLGGNFFASPVLAGDRIYATSESGVTHVFRAAREFEPLAENDLGETCFATLAICADAIFLRSTAHLFCIKTAANQE